MRILIVMCSLLVMTACSAPITKDHLRQQASEKTQFEVAKPYQQVFAKILSQTRACYSQKPSVRQITVVGLRDNGKKTANVVVKEVYALAGEDAYLVIDVVSKTRVLTQVSVYASQNAAKKEVESVKSWALEGSEQCDVSWLS